MEIVRRPGTADIRKSTREKKFRSSVLVAAILETWISVLVRLKDQRYSERLIFLKPGHYTLLAFSSTVISVLRTSLPLQFVKKSLRQSKEKPSV